ncbi:MAG: ferric reductase-like transmembrane domain-containing protein [Candidatus Saccharimonadales bacterium]
MSAKKSAVHVIERPYSLLTNNRFWLLCFSALLSIITVVAVWVLFPPGDLRLIRTQQTYGLLSIVFLYFALLAAPLTKIFPNMRGKNEYLHLRRAIGVSAFFFALLHALVAFFGQLGGFNGLGFLSPRYSIALLLGFIALIILTVMAVTSFDKVIDKMGFRRWKRLHRLIYIAGLAILVHIVMLGTHYAYGSSSIARLTLVAVLILFMLEAVRMDRWLKKRFTVLRHFGVASMVLLQLLFLVTGFMLGKNSKLELGDIRAHNEHSTQTSNSPTEPYISFESAPIVDGKTIQINQQQISFQDLIAGGAILNFTSQPAFTDITAASCFLVNQQTYGYYQGLTKTVGSTIQCLPIGDAEPPEPGVYTLYLRLERAVGVNTIPFNLEITP